MSTIAEGLGIPEIRLQFLKEMTNMIHQHTGSMSEFMIEVQERTDLEQNEKLYIIHEFSGYLAREEIKPFPIEKTAADFITHLALNDAKPTDIIAIAGIMTHIATSNFNVTLMSPKDIPEDIMNEIKSMFDSISKGASKFRPYRTKKD